MNILPTQCPLCDGEITVTRIHCRDCDTFIEGRFSGGPFSDLTHEQIEFVEMFVRNEGKIKRMEEELGLSYPTIRNRLYEIIRAMGYEPGAIEEEGLTEEERQSILEQLNNGDITAEQAMELLRES